MSENTGNLTLPVVVLRGMTMYPGMNIHFDAQRKSTVKAVKAAMAGDRKVFLITLKDASEEEPEAISAFYDTGCICRVHHTLAEDGERSFQVSAQGIERGRPVEILSRSPYMQMEVEETPSEAIPAMKEKTASALLRIIHTMLTSDAPVAEFLPRETVAHLAAIEDLGKLVDLTASKVVPDISDKQLFLSELDPVKRAEYLVELLFRENELLSLESEIIEKTHERMDENQREYFLNEQMKMISEELNGSDENECELFREKIYSLKLDEDSEKKLLTECSRLEKMAPMSPEATVIRTYLETVTELPWNKRTKDKTDLEKAQRTLDADHYGMKDVKKRLIELMAVQSLAPGISGQILCLVGPPGVGKTSIAASAARAMGKKYARVALGGVKDEAEIRGHRKTYIGSMPGRIIEAVRKAGSSNPLILLDEIDKLGADYKGDPSSALLEVLDGEQNKAFVDHYLEIPFDLSKVLFITTANNRETIPLPLQDRMEIIDMDSYTEEEKFLIAKKHLIPKQKKMHGLTGRTLRISDAALRRIIDGYTREAGVRQLEREIAVICRRAAVAVKEGEEAFSVTPANLESILGQMKYRRDDYSLDDETGLARGLAWTSVGGEMLDVEAAVFEGSGKLELTGSLGDVMKESAHAAISFIRANHGDLGVDADFYKNRDIHLHFPEGAVPKDGPSAGITIATALVSALTERPVKGDLAMTGEITLRGRVLPIGGLKEKSMAAYRAGTKKVIIPKRNLPDLEKVDEKVRDSLEFIPVSSAMEVMKIALV